MDCSCVALLETAGDMLVDGVEVPVPEAVAEGA